MDNTDLKTPVLTAFDNRNLFQVHNKLIAMRSMLPFQTKPVFAQ